MLKITKLVEGIVEVKGVRVVNTTSKPIRLTNEDLTMDVTIQPSGVEINANVEITEAYSCANATLEMTDFIDDKETKVAIQEFLSEYPDVILIGTSVTAQAYPGLIVTTVTHPNAPSEEKRMMYNRYTVYPGRPEFE